MAIDNEVAPVTVKFLNFEVKSRLLNFNGSFEYPDEGGRSAVDVLDELATNHNEPDETIRVTVNIQEMKITTYRGFVKRLTSRSTRSGTTSTRP